MGLFRLTPPGIGFFGLAAACSLAMILTANRAFAEETADGAGAPRLERSECVTDALAEAGAECYTFHAQEDREQPNGTMIEVPVAVLKPESEAAPSSEPVFFFPGGPGYSILGDPDIIAQYRKDVGARTLVLMNHRGMLHTEPALRCADYAEVSPYHNSIFTPGVSSSLDTMERLRSVTDAVEECYRKLADEGTDVAQYNSYAIAHDVDESRRLLDYERIDLYGRSTGGGTALAYMRYFPESVRAAVLVSPWYNNLRNRPPIDEFYTTKQKYTDVLGLCVAESSRCQELLSGWALAIERARRALDDRPFVATVEAGDEGQKTLYFDGAAFLHTLYLTLPDVYARLPGIVNEVQRHDYSSLESFFQIEEFDPEPEAPRYALGYFLAHVCNDMGELRPTPGDSIDMVRREPAILGFEPPWVCAWWGTDGAVPPEHNFRNRSDKPTLSIHGQMDACCDIRWGQHLEETMENIQYVELQGRGHTPNSECGSALIARFLKEPDAPVDESCKRDTALEPWAME